MRTWTQFCENAQIVKDQVYNAILSLAPENHNHLYIYDLGKILHMSPEILLPIIDLLRREWKISGSALEGRYGINPEQQKYVTKDGVGIVSLKE